MKFRTKHCEIDAFQFRPIWSDIGCFAKDAPVWFLQAECDGTAKVWSDSEEPYCMIETLEGRMKADAGDWIIKGLKGELYPCKADIFVMKYEPITH